MPMKFPKPEETVWCPLCKANCAFCREEHHEDYEQCIQHSSSRQHEGRHVIHNITARFCRSCGFPIIRHRVGTETFHGTASSWRGLRESLYPQYPTRSKIAKLVRDEDSDLADDYDQAVACEPHSPQAAVILLSRVLSQILIDKCGANRPDGLSAQIKTAKNGKFIPSDIEAEIDLIHHSRNQVGHVWYDDQGDHLKVTVDDAVWWFEIVDFMLNHLYVKPAEAKARLDRIQNLKTAKKAGDNT